MEKEIKQVNEFSIQYPEAKQDITLLKTILTPQELWLVKFIIHDLLPFTTRQMYSTIIHCIYFMNFDNEKFLRQVSESLKNNMKYMKYLKSSEFNTPFEFIQGKEKKRIEKKWLDQTKDKSSTETADIEAKILTEARTRHPSYEGIRTTLDGFYKIGLLSKRKAHGKDYWLINPQFYRAFKDKFKGILELYHIY